MSVVSYTKAKIDALLGGKQDAGDYATNTALTSGLTSKVNSSTYTAGLAAKADLASGVVPDAQLPTRLSAAGLTSTIDARGTANGWGSGGGAASPYPTSLPAGVTLAHTFDPRNQTYNLGAATLGNWRAAIARARAGGVSARLACIGDSTTEGANLGSGYQNASYPARLPGLLGTTDLPAVSGGFLLNDNANGTDTRYTSLPSGWSFSAAAGYSNALLGATSASGPAVLTVTGQDTLRVYWASNSGLGTCVVTVNDGAAHAKTVNTSGAAGTGFTEWTGLTPGTQTISFAVPTVSSVLFTAVETFSATGKLLVAQQGQSGAASTNLLSGGSGGGFTAEATLLNVGAAKPDLTALMMLLNDWNTSVAPATAQANLQSFITAAKSAAQDFLLVVPVPPNEASGTHTYPWSAYVQVIYALADANNLPLVDLTARWVDHATASAHGYKADNLHPTSAGYYDLAQAVADAVREAGGNSAGSGVALPTQTGNAGKFLTTNGTSPAWGTPAGGAGLTLPTQVIQLAPSGDTTGAADQAALTSAVATLLGNTVKGGTIVLGGGDWYWTHIAIDIYATPARIKIVGQGQATRVHSTATGTPARTTALFDVYGGGDVAPYPDQQQQGATALNWVEISDMELDGNAAACGIALTGVYQGRLGNIYGRGFTGTGKYATPLFLAYAIDVVVENPLTFACTRGMYMEGWSNINNVLGGWFASSTLAGVEIVGGSFATGNNFYGTVFQTAGATGLLVGAGVSATHLYGCWFENNGRGLITAGATTLVDGAVFGSNGHDIDVNSPATETIISRPWQLASVAVAAGTHYTVIEHAPSAFTYANGVVSDGTNGTEVCIVRATPVSAGGGGSSSAPGLVTGVTVGTPTSTTVPLSWTAPASNGGSAITDYVVQYSSNGGTSWATFADGTSTATSTTVTGLTASTAYSFRVAAVNALGTGSYSAPPTLASTAASGGGGGGAGSSGPALSTLRGTPTYAAGKFGNGMSGGVLALASTVTVGAAGTFEAWVKPIAAGGTTVVIGNADSWLGMRSGLYTYGPSGQSPRQGSITNNPGVWQHLALVTNGTTTWLFVDGQIAYTETFALSLTWANLAIGGYGSDNSIDWGGSIDEVRISNVARYTAAFTPPTSAFTVDANTLALYHLDS